MEKFLRNFGNSKLMVTSTAPIFFAAAIEYIAAEILDLASISSKDFKRVRITIRDLELAIRNDEELDSLFIKLNISFLGGGVLPFIHSSLLKKNKKKKQRNFIGKNNENKPHRFRAGTVAIRDIKKHQKTSNYLILPKFSFERFVRVIFKETQQTENQKISKDVFLVLQYFIEQYIVNILKNANFLAIHAGRVKLMPVDIGLVSCFYNNTKNPYNLSLNDDNLDILSINDDEYVDNIDGDYEYKENDEDVNTDNKQEDSNNDVDEDVEENEDDGEEVLNEEE
jgi:histone H3/H4